jgi:D-amino-acid dehydrogenase
MEDAGVVAETDSGEIEASHVVMATGALSPKLANIIGWRAPIQPGKGYSLTMPRPNTCPAIPLVFPETRVAVTPFSSGYRLGSTMEFSGYDQTLNPKRVDLLRKGAERFLLEPYCEPVETTWYGWRPMTYDSVPIIGTCPGRPKVTIATGHNMLGLSMAPATGKFVAELVTGETPHLTPEPYSPDRF